MIKSGKTLGRSISMSLTVNVPVYTVRYYSKGNTSANRPAINQDGSTSAHIAKLLWCGSLWIIIRAQIQILDLEILYPDPSKTKQSIFPIRVLRTLFWSFCLNYLLWICDPPIGAAHCTVSCNVNLMTLWQFRKNQIFCGPLHRSFVDGWPQPFTRTNSSGLPGLPDHWNWMHSRNHSSRGAECDSRFHQAHIPP